MRIYSKFVFLKNRKFGHLIQNNIDFMKNMARRINKVGGAAIERGGERRAGKQPAALHKFMDLLFICCTRRSLLFS